MNKDKILLTAIAYAGLSAGYDYRELRVDYTKFQYAGLSKNSPSHAQQKRDSKKAKNKGRG
jgi:hypothetical protein